MLRKVADWILLAFVATMVVGLIGHVVERWLGFPPEPRLWVQIAAGVGLGGAAVMALTIVHVWPPTQEGINAMPDSTKSNGVP